MQKVTTPLPENPSTNTNTFPKKKDNLTSKLNLLHLSHNTLPLIQHIHNLLHPL
jgi:hypothetical protein